MRRRLDDLEAEISRLRAERSGQLARAQDVIAQLERHDIDPERFLRKPWIRVYLGIRRRWRKLLRRLGRL